MSNNYYVYTATVDGVLRYVGKGTKDRYKHCTSGISSCPELNRDFFEGRDIVVKKIKTGLTNSEAETYEQQLISENFEQLYNKVVKNKHRQLARKSSLMKDTEAIERSGNFFVDYNKSKINKYLRQNKNETFAWEWEDEKERILKLNEALGALGLEMVLISVNGGKPVVIIERYYWDSNYDCLGCFNYSKISTPKKCPGYKTVSCCLGSNFDSNNTPGHR